MDSLFQIYVRLGFEHIANWQAYDHILFLWALCGVYKPRAWKALLWMVTVFTIGHSITLALGTTKVISFSEAWIEFLIPLTILATAIYHIKSIRHGYPFDKLHPTGLILAFFFGLIHGLGFSTYFGMLWNGMEAGYMIKVLFPFSLGVELGQMVLVAAILGITAIIVGGIKVPIRYWQLITAIVSGLLALVLAISRFPAF